MIQKKVRSHVFFFSDKSTGLKCLRTHSGRDQSVAGQSCGTVSSCTVNVPKTVIVILLIKEYTIYNIVIRQHWNVGTDIFSACCKSPCVRPLASLILSSMFVFLPGPPNLQPDRDWLKDKKRI